MSQQEQFTGRCPMCSYSANQVARPVSSQINTYTNEKGEKAIFSRHDDIFETVNGVKWTKQAPAPGTAPIQLVPSTSEQIKAVAAFNTEGVSFEGQAGDPVTGVAKGATIIGAPTGARDSVTSALNSLGKA